MKKMLSGTVISVKMKNTAVVVVERKLRHAQYKKVITRRKKYKAHYDGDMKINEGDVVRIQETRPIAKDTHFIIIKGPKTSQ